MKKTAFILFPFLFIALFLSCKQGREREESFNSDDKFESGVISNDTGKVSEPGSENFNIFVERFSQEQSFQLNRIKFPISIVVPDAQDEGMAPIKETISKYEWEFLDLTYDSTYLTRPYDQYYQVVRFRNDTAVVEIRGINNGIYADYYFALIDNEWYLVTLYEASF